ncbi:MAG: hypothetical protein M0Q25_07680 [Sulfurospirillaceae bacterium]|nr:hypothetical protein [Sulfurospirillaceae bacterium]
MRVINLIFTLLIALGLSGCTKEYMKVPFSVEVDFSKKGTVYETDFKAPWNIWGSEVEFYIYLGINWISSDSKEGRIYDYIRTGVLREEGENGKKIPTEETPYFKLKVTLTPLGRASDNVIISSPDYSKIELSQKYVWRKRQHKDEGKIEFTIDIPLYGGDTSKELMIADLQRLRNYHIRVESLEDVELPDGVYIGFVINRHSRKV